MNIKKRLSLLAVALLALSVASCTAGEESAESGTDTAESVSSSDSAPASDATTATDTAGTPQETEKETAPVVYSELNDLQKMTTPFWLQNTMHRESTCMIVREDGAITAKLAFKPTKVLSVEDHSLTKVFEEGKDYTWDGKTNTLVWVEGSAIPYFTQNDIEGKREDGTQVPAFDGSDASWDELGRSRFGNQLYCVGEFLYEKQIAVTYEYEYGAWDGEKTAYQGELLDTTLAKLEAKETVNVFFYGDSIFTGCDSSAMYNRPPMQKSFPAFTKQVLEERYEGARVKLYNPSVGGKDSAWGKDNVQTLVCDRAAPDLVVIGFGMNDSGSGRATAKNVQAIMDTIRAQYPACEFIVVSPMVPNAAAGFLTTQNQLSAAYKHTAGEMEGVAFVDMFACHQKLLLEKDFISMSGNNINHPNDWLIRVYTMQILSALLEY